MSSYEQQLAQFMAAIRQVESSNNYQAIGQNQGHYLGVARGAYQIMSGNWDNWTRQAGIGGADWRDPRAQDHVARHFMGQYYQRYRDWRLVAAAWFAGPGTADRMRNQMGSGGSSLQIVQNAMRGLNGLRITSTYRTPEQEARLPGGSPTSWHLNRDNPAVDVGGPTDQLDELARRLRALGLNAELLWRTAGHYDHVHFAVRDRTGSGGMPDPSDGTIRTSEYIQRVMSAFGGDPLGGAQEAQQQALEAAYQPDGQEDDEMRTDNMWLSVVDSLSHVIKQNPDQFAGLYADPAGSFLDAASLSSDGQHQDAPIRVPEPVGQDDEEMMA